jgi:hypothetical protein
VNRHLTQDCPDLAGLSHVHSRSLESDRSAAKAALMLPVGPALMVILLLSLGLWGAIWLATSSLFSS